MKTTALLESEPDAESRSRSAQESRARHAVLLLLPIAWGVLLFGAVYPWAYIPMLAAVTTVGVYGLTTASSRDRRPLRGLVPALLLVLAVTLAQIAPIPASWLTRVSPHSVSLARQYDRAFTTSSPVGDDAWHAISIATDSTVTGLVFLAALAVFFAGTTALMPRVRLTWLIRRLTALGLALAVFGIVQKGTFNGRIYWVWSPIEIAANAFGPFVNRNHFAGWMLMAASLTAGYVCSLIQPHANRRHRRNWRERVAALATPEASRLLFISCALAVMALSIVWTMSRSGIGAFAVATSLLAGLAFARRRGWRRMATGAFLISTVLFALWWRGIDTMTDWYSRTSTLEWRVQLWHDTAAIMRDFPWFGTGLNTYGVSTLLYPMTDQTLHAVEAHNDYVQIASEGGVALVFAVLFLAWQLARAIRTAFAQPQSSSLYWIRAGATVGLVAIAVQELSDFSLQMPGNAVLFVVLAAIAVHRPRRPWRPTPGAAAPPAPESADTPPPVVLADLDLSLP